LNISLDFPLTFHLVNRRWRVELLSKRQWKAYLREQDQKQHWKDSLGHCDSARAYIALNRDHPDHKDPAQFFHTLLHELTHAVFFAEGATNHDEEQVDRLGGFAAQIIQTLEQGS